MSTENQSNNDDSGWKSWSNFVLKTLEKLDFRLTNLEETVNEHNTSVQKSLVELQTKASISGAIVGIVTSIIVSIVSGVILYNINNSSKETKYTHPPGYTQQYYPPQQQIPMTPQQVQPQIPQVAPQNNPNEVGK